MEFLEKILGTKKRRQESLLRGLGILQEPRREFVGPNFEEALVAKVDNDRFLEILEAQEKTQYRSHLINQSDTHQAFDLFLDIGEGVQIKTAVASVDYSPEETLLTKLHEMGFRYDAERSKERWGQYRREV